MRWGCFEFPVSIFSSSSFCFHPKMLNPKTENVESNRHHNHHFSFLEKINFQEKINNQLIFRMKNSLFSSCSMIDYEFCSGSNFSSSIIILSISLLLVPLSFFLLLFFLLSLLCSSAKEKWSMTEIYRWIVSAFNDFEKKNKNESNIFNLLFFPLLSVSFFLSFFSFSHSYR